MMNLPRNSSRDYKFLPFNDCNRSPQKMKAATILVFLLLFSSLLYAQEPAKSDTTTVSGKGNADKQLSVAQDSKPLAPRKKGGLVKAFIIPVAIGAVGLWSFDKKYAVRDWRNENFPHFKTMSDDAIQYVPMVTVYALNALGIRGKNDIANETALLLKSAVLVTAVFFVLKYSYIERRPDNSDNASFPSGHTEQAFGAAAFLQKEYGHKSVWYTIAGYTVATGVGAMRILNNKHYLPDVLIGAAAGILSVNLVYLTHKGHWGKNKKKSQSVILPSYGRGPGIYFCYRFK
jgi:membrane-associated phospholipid phosphatase